MDEFAQRSETFWSWLSSLPGVSIHADISLADLREQGAGRGIVASNDIPEDTDLFTIPRSAVLSTTTSDLASRVPHVFQSQDDAWLALILVLLYEHSRGAESPWRDYLSVLPETFDTLIFWSEEELDELQASDVRSKTGKEAADELFTTDIVTVVRDHPDVFGASLSSLPDEGVLQLAHRMASTIMAYAFDLQRDAEAQPDDDGYATEDEEYGSLPKGMVPLADMLNADAEFNAHLFQGPDSLTMKSLRPIARGEEILNDYGPLPRSDLLRRYGYVTAKYARYDVVELPQADLVALCQEATGSSRDDLISKIDAATDGEVDISDHLHTFLLERDNEDTDDSGLNSSTPEPTLPEEAVALTKMLLMRPDEGTRVSRVHQARQAELEQQAGKILEQLVQGKLRAYATTIAQDQNLLQDGNLSRRRRMAIEVRMGEKQLLHEAVEITRIMQHTSNGHADDLAPSSKKQRTG